MQSVVELLAVWTALSVVLVGTWNLSTGRRRPAPVRVYEPRSHVVVIDPTPLAPVISLDAHRATTSARAASAS